jgi:hypothetical protein
LNSGVRCCVASRGRSRSSQRGWRVQSLIES